MNGSPMKTYSLIICLLVLLAGEAVAQNPSACRISFPNGGEVFRPGSTQELRWDTAGTFRSRWRFKFGTSPIGPWTTLTGLTNVLDSGATRGQSVPTSGGWRVPSLQTMSGYLRMELIADSNNVYDVSDNPFTIIAPDIIKPDSVLRGEITRSITLSNTKIYGLDGYVYVSGNATLTLQPGTIVVGDTVGQNSVLCITRGSKIIADGTKELPIVFTSAAAPGQRARGDWGGVVICGNARTNHPGGQAAIEGGIADATVGGRGWFGGSDDNDNSGILRYVRIEFAGIAVAPNNELNGLTMGAVGRGTVLDYIQVSHSNDDAFEWFGGTVNARHLIAYGALDDDFDTDNGFSGRVQFGVGKRFRQVADVSTSQHFESDNDANSTFNQPLTSAIFSNMTLIGPLQDTSWTAGFGPNQYHPRFGAAAQIRRNSRESIVNSIFMGWPRGIEIAQAPTMVAANGDSLLVRNNDWYGVKGTWLNLAGGTPPAGMDANWIAKAEFSNNITKQNPNAALIANPWPEDANFNPVTLGVAPYLTTGRFDNGSASVSITDPNLVKVAYRGAFNPEEARWDAGWANYDPVNTEYRAQVSVKLKTPGAASGESYVMGDKIDITWDTTNAAGNTFKFEFGTSQQGPWAVIAGAEAVVDNGATRGKLTKGFMVPNVATTTGYIKMTLVNDPSKFDVSDVAFAIVAPKVDPVVRLIEPGTNVKSVRVGQSVDITWDTTGTYRQRWRFEFGKSASGPWSAMAGLSNVLDSGARRGRFAAGVVFRPSDVTTTGYIRMTLLSDTTKTDVNDVPFAITAPQPTKVDSVLHGEITGKVKLSNTKIYGLDGYVYVNDGAVLEIEPGTIILGDTVGQNSVLCINRGGKILARGTSKLPIVFTSNAVPGQRSRGDWGGVVICGKARTNHPGGQAAIEGGIADAATGGKGWFGGTDDDDSSGVLSYVRIEFAGIAVAPNNELNGLTLGAVGRKTAIDHIQVSYSNDDAYEWFGGSVNAKYLIATGALDDDFDTDNGFSGRVQFAIGQRFRTVADVSTSQTFESDNDANATYNQPLTQAVFSNVTSIGPLQDTSWTTGSGANQFSARFGAAVQIRRNSRLAIHNSLFLGWPRGIEIAQLPTMNAALADSIEVRNSSWYGVKSTVMNLAGLSGGQTAPAGFDVSWIAKPAFGNIVDKSSPLVASVTKPFETTVEFNPALQAGSPALTGAAFSGRADDAYFQRVDFRGAVGLERWDEQWTEYDPINREYLPQAPVSVNEDGDVAGMSVVAYPNPTSAASTVRYTIGQDDVVDVRLSDATGAVVSTFISREAQRAGIYEFRLITADLASGVYFLTITGVRGTVTLPISVAQ